jgi:DNA-binding MarR family transcriptional regulator
VTDPATVDKIARGLDRWNALLGRLYGPLSRPQRRIMRLLALQSETRVGSLAVDLGITAAGATKMLDLLEREGYVRRVRRPDSDQRQVYISLTASGAEALRLADLAFVASVEASLESLSNDQLESLGNLVDRIGTPPAGNHTAQMP